MIDLFFKNYEEALKIILIILHDMNEDSRKTMKRNIRVIERFYDIYNTDKEKIRGLLTSFFRLDEMYCNEEALDLGFEKYLIKEAKNIRQALEYHKANCPVFEGKPRSKCEVCRITDEMVVELL